MDEFCDKLTEELPEILMVEAISCVRRHLLTQEDFESLSLGELAEAFPTMGVRKAICRVIGKTKHLEDHSAPATGGSQRSDSDHDGKSCVIVGRKRGSSDNCNWARTLEIPSLFSPSTMKSIKEEKLTRKARVEIVNAVYSRMIEHTEYPTSEQYMTVCWRLVEKFDALKDKMGNGIGTWKEQIKQKFRNQRRAISHQDSVAESSYCHAKVGTGEVKEKYGRIKRCNNAGAADGQKNSKKKKPGAGIIHDTTVKVTNDDGELYELHKEKLVKEMEKTVPKRKKIMKLSQKTFAKRRQWIVKDVPAATEIINEFPLFKDPQYLIQEMLCILNLESCHDFMTPFNEWCNKIEEYGKVERRRCGVQDVLEKLNACSVEDLKSKYSLMLLKLLVAPRSKHSILNEWQDTENFDHELAKLPSFPAIVVLNSDDNTTFFVVVEQKLLCRCNDIHTAVVALIGTYFSFDMSYPPGLSAILIFIQHFMLQLKDDQAIPNAVKIAYSAMEHL